MGRTITYLLTAAVVAVGGISAATPAQAAQTKITCTNPGNGDVCLHVWPSGRAAVSYKKLRGPRINGELVVHTKRYGSSTVFSGVMEAGYTYSGHADYASNICKTGILYYSSAGSWKYAQTRELC